MPVVPYLRFSQAAATLLLVFVLVACSQTTRDFNPGAVERDVRIAFSQFKEHLNAGDYDGALGFYANDARFRAYEDGELRYESWKQLAEVYAQLPNYGPGRFDYGEPQLTPLSPEHAHLAVTFDTAFGTPGTPGYFQFDGLLTALCVKGETGWAMLKIHSSVAKQRDE